MQLLYRRLKKTLEYARRNPLTGLSGLQRQTWPRTGRRCSRWSQSPYGAKWFATVLAWLQAAMEAAKAESQSPYGAKWFATVRPGGQAHRHRDYRRRNPLTGLSGLQPELKIDHNGMALTSYCRNPLTGLSGLQPPRLRHPPPIGPNTSQSPYGAKWFATRRAFPPRTPASRATSRNPLTGLSGLQPLERGVG